MIIIKELNDNVLLTNSLIETASLVMVQDSGIYFKIIKNRLGQSDVFIHKDLLMKVITNPSGKIVTDWK